MARGALACMIFIILTASVATTQAAAETKITVDHSGKGDYTKIQEAIDSVRSNNADPVTISVKPGTYKETITVPPDKPNITLTGSTGKASDVIITWDQNGEINETATFHVSANNFIARDITFQNTYGRGARAVALRVSGDQAAFYSCSITGFQDTLFDEIGRHYYENCYIEGATDFIFGNAASFYQSCHIHSLDQGWITSQRNEAPGDRGGFVFKEGQITGELKKTDLGRPWGVSYSRVIFIYTQMDNVITPEGWDPNHQSEEALKANSACGQFKCYGPGATTSKRVKWAREFSDQEIEPYLTTAFIDGKDWLKTPPITHSPPPSSASKPEHLPPPAPVVIPSSPPPPPPVVIPSSPPPPPPVVIPPSPPPPPVVIPPSPPPPPVVIPPSPPPPPVVIPSSPPPPPVVIPSSPPPPPVVIPSPPPLSPVVIPLSAPPALATAAPSPPPPSAGRVIVTPWSGIWKDEGGEPIVMIYYSGASSLLSSFSSITTMALSAAILLYLIV